MDMHTLQSLRPKETRKRAGAHRATAAWWTRVLPLSLFVGIIIGVSIGTGIVFLGPSEAESAISYISEDSTPTDDTDIISQDAETKPTTPPNDDEEPSSDAPEPAPPTPEDPFADIATSVIDKTNEARQSHGCGPVTANNALRQAATKHSQDMATNDYFSHTSQDGRSFTDRAQEAGYHHAIGENIAYGYATAQDVINGWLDSPGHRANIMNCNATAIGIGIGETPDGTLYWTQMFGSQ